MSALSTATRISEFDLEGIQDEPWLTKKQRELVQSLIRNKYHVKMTAEDLGIIYRTTQKRVRVLKKKILKMQVDDFIPEGMIATGTSTYYSVDEETGEKREKGQWIKTKRSDVDELEAIKYVTKKLAKKVDGIAEPKDVPVYTEDGMLVVYVTTDMHLGEYAWREETGKDVNTESVYNNTLGAAVLLNKTTPRAKNAIVLDLGDTMHASNDANRTKSGNELDVDTRHAKVFKMLVDLKIKMIDMALEKHENVKYVIVPGNHSDLIGHYLVAMLSAYYRNEPRFEVDESAAMHKYHRFGKTLLGFHHGHATKLQRLPEVMVWDRKEDISDTDYRYWLTGHVHRDTVIDNPICRMESFRNLTSNDAWAAGAGYRGTKQAVAITYSDTYGEIARNTVSIAEVENANGNI